MDYLAKLRRLFLYAGLEKETYLDIRPRIMEENLVLLKVFSRLGALMFFALLISSLVSRGFVSVNSKTYMVCGVVMMLIWLCAEYCDTKRPATVMALVYVFELMLYVFGIHISLLHAEKAAVSAIVFLVVTPLLFYDAPIKLSVLIAAVAAVFCVMVARYKEPDVAESDIWNIVTFGALAVATSLFMMSIKLRALAQARQIEYMSRTDLLTGTRNRNCFENQLARYPEMCTSGLICVYADVNGLHEKNNREGHSAGDRMLREVASGLRQCFGEEHTYRVGGDEFVAFRVDGKPEEVRAELDRTSRKLREEGYHVSFGMAAQSRAQGELNMDELIRAAENSMFSAKKSFYSMPEFNRRNR